MSVTHVRFGHVSELDTEPEKIDLETLDVAAANRAAFEQQFPGVLADGVIDAERLKDLLDVDVVGAADDRERYGLMWAGKKEAVRSLQTPSRGTLIPDFDASVDWDTAQNVFIEGDNLEVLKLLQKSYNDQIKLVYIDPPYNTGNDFVYNDDFSDGLRGYLEWTEQLDAEGNRSTSSPEVLGRKHSRWLSMLYPRLILARNLLAQDGAIFVSIDDREVHALRALMDEVFGPENFVGTFVWRKKYTLSFRDEYQISVHEYIVAYRRGGGTLALRDPRWDETETVAVNPVFKSQNAASTKIIRAGARLTGGAKISKLAAGHYELRSQTLRYLDDAHFEQGVLQADVRVTARYGVGQETLDKSQVEISSSGAAYIVGKKAERTIKPLSILFDYTKDDREVMYRNYLHRKSASTRQATADLEELLGGKFFDNPKPVALIGALVSYMDLGDGDVVLDFFAGSGTTAHAVAKLNSEDGISRRCISVNLPEPTPADSPARNVGFHTVSAITETRIRRAIETVQGAQKEGLRVERLGPSHFYDSTLADDEELFDMRESTLQDRDHTMESVAQEVLLKEGVRLDATWERHKAAGAPVIIADGVAAVLALDLTQEIADAALELKPKVVVFLEDGFAGADAVKANAFTNAKNAGIVMKTV